MTDLTPTTQVSPERAPTPPSPPETSTERVEPVELTPPAPGSPPVRPLSVHAQKLETYKAEWERIEAIKEPPKGASPAFKRLWEDSFKELSDAKPRVVTRKRVTLKNHETGEFEHEYREVLVPAPVTIGEILSRISLKLGEIFDETVGKFDQTLAVLTEKVAKAEKLSEKAGWAEILSLAKANLITSLMFAEGPEREKATSKALDVITKLADAELKKQVKDGVAGSAGDTTLDLLTKLRDARERLEKERKTFSETPKNA